MTPAFKTLVQIDTALEKEAGLNMGSLRSMLSGAKNMATSAGRAAKTMGGATMKGFREAKSTLNTTPWPGQSRGSLLKGELSNAKNVMGKNLQEGFDSLTPRQIQGLQAALAGAKVGLPAAAGTAVGMKGLDMLQNRGNTAS